MAALVLGAAGGIIGGMFGGAIGAQIGFLAGSLLANLLDPPKVEGPRIGDTKLQRSTYGSMLPYVWGSGVRIGTNVIDQTDLEEHSETSSGKGGPETTTYSYTASWLAALCVRLPNRDAAIAGVSRIWADGRIIWSAEGGGEMPCTVYYGTESQGPEPTFEGIHGVGFQPGYRGIAYLAFTDLDLGPYGNRIPMIEAEVYTQVGDFPYRVAEFSPWPDVLNRVSLGAVQVKGGGVATISAYTTSPPDYLHAEYREFDGDGTPRDLVNSTDYIVHGAWPGYQVYMPLMNGDPPGFLAYASASVFNWVVFDPNLGWVMGGALLDFTWTGTTPVQSNYPVYMEGYVYYVSKVALESCFCRLGPYNSEFAVGSVLTELPGPLALAGDNFALGVDYGNSHIYVAYDQGPGNGVDIWEYDTEGNLINQWDATANASNTELAGWSGSNFHVHNGLLAYEVAGTPRHLYVVRLNSDGTLETVGTNIETSGGRPFPIGASGLGIDHLGIYSLNPPGVPDVLSAIVEDITTLTPLARDGSPANDIYDFSELTDEVEGYIIANVMTARNALDPLRKVYFFDIIENDFRVEGIKRGDRTIHTIPDEDLAAHADGDNPDSLLKTARTREQELPRTVSMKYYDRELDYNTGVQASPRQVTESENDVTIDVPIVLSAAEAQQKCWVIQTTAWEEREEFEWSTSLKWVKLNPTDIAKVQGRDIRIIDATQTPDGILTFKGVINSPTLYDQTQAEGVVGAGGGSSGAGSGQGPGQPPGGGAGGGSGGGGGGEGSVYNPYLAYTRIELLDIPPISQAAAPFGFYAALAPVQTNSVIGNATAWPGATLFKSLDGGISYTAVKSVTTVTTMGYVLPYQYSSGSPTYTAYPQLGTWTSGTEVIDETEIVVSLGDPRMQSLTSISAEALTRGGNLCAIQRTQDPAITGYSQRLWELCCFRDATLLSIAPSGAKVYLLKGFRRGLFNTGTSGHGEIPYVGGFPNYVTHDRFVLMSTAYNIDAPESELNDLLVYKGITNGDFLVLNPEYYFTNTGIGAEEYYNNTNNNLPVFNGDVSGSPTVTPNQGLVPPPSAGDCAADKFLSACGTWKVPTGTGGGGGLDVTDLETVLTSANALLTIAPGVGSPSTILFTANKQLVVITTPYASTVTIDLSSYSIYPHVLVNVVDSGSPTFTGAFTFNISNGFDGQIVRTRFFDTAGRTVTWGSNIRFSSDLPAQALTTTASRTDQFAFQWNTTAGKADMIASNKGFG